jgi:predicted esterase
MIRPPSLLALLGLLAATAFSQEEPVKRLTADQMKAVRAAALGDAKALDKIAKVGPLTKEAAAAVEDKVLRAWPFKGMGGGTERIDLEIGGRKLEYALRVPKGYSPKKAWPLIVSLHGAGGNGPGELSFIWGGQLSDWKGFIAAPSGQPPGAQWFPEQEPFVLGMIRDVMERASIDSNRIYVHGFSNGGNGAWFYAEQHPGLFAAMCTRGGGNPSPNLLPNLLHLPAYIIHGENDPVIQVDSDRRDAAALEKMGYTVAYTEVKGGSHQPFNEENPKVLDFFVKHPRDPWAKKLVLLTPGRGETFRNRWIEVPANAGGRIEAEVKDGNVVEIQGTSRAVLWLSDALLDLDAEIVVRLGGAEAFRGKVERRLTTLVDDLRARMDRQAPAWTKVEVGR